MKTTATKKISFIIMMVFSLSFVLAQTTNTGQRSADLQLDNVQVINPVIGDVSFITKFGCQPDVTTDEDLRIQTHLEYAEHLLRQKDVSNLTPEAQLKRQHLLDLLHDYWTAGKFPRNYDYMETRKPCFIDKDNTICAVGYLVEKTAGRQVAEEINQNHKYDFVYEMNDDMVDGWIASSGLTKEECATIQPDYGGGGWGNPCSGNKVWTCRYSNCVYECKCLNPNNAENWQSHGHPCDTLGNNGNGNGNFGSALINRQVSEKNKSYGDLYPNPVTRTATFHFSMDQLQRVTIKVFDMNGKLVSTLADSPFEAGEYKVEWNAENAQAGIYFLLMETPISSESRKLLVVK